MFNCTFRPAKYLIWGVTNLRQTRFVGWFLDQKCVVRPVRLLTRAFFLENRPVKVSKTLFSRLEIYFEANDATAAAGTASRRAGEPVRRPVKLKIGRNLERKYSKWPLHRLESCFFKMSTLWNDYCIIYQA